MEQAGSYGIGIDLGGTTFTVGVFTQSGEALCHASQDTPSTGDPELIARALAEAAREQMAAVEAPLDEVVGVAIGFPGPVDPDTGVVKHAPNIHCLAGYALTAAVSRYLDGAEVSLQNDAYCATLAELRWGAGRNVANMLMLTLGTGIGGGVALCNEVVRGPRQILGEVGHIIIDPNGRKCGCGCFGCLEAVAAKQAIIDLAASEIQSGRPTLLTELVAGDQEALTPEVVARAAEEGDAAAVSVYERIGFHIGVALCNCIVLTDPDLIVLGGGIAAAGDVLFGPIRRTVAARSLISGFDVSKIVPARFGNLAGIYGAGALAWEQAHRAAGFGVRDCSPTTSSH